MVYRKRGMKSKAVIKKRLWSKFKAKQNNKNIVRIVKQTLAKKIETKYTNASSVDGYVGQWATGSTKVWYHFPLVPTLNMSQGTAQGNRIGNSIRLKRWVLKGTIHPGQEVNVSPTTTNYLRYSHQGYAMVYLLKRTDGEAIDTELPGLFQNGNASYAAAGTYLDHMLPINKDKYKVYASRKFKLGPSSPISASSTDNNIMLNNNDFKLVADFGFDITRFVGKNAMIKYNDGLTTAQPPAALKNLEIVCVWSPPFGSFSAQTLATSTTFYKISCTCHAEYEDA